MRLCRTGHNLFYILQSCYIFFCLCHFFLINLVTSCYISIVSGYKQPNKHRFSHCNEPFSFFQQFCTHLFDIKSYSKESKVHSNLVSVKADSFPEKKTFDDLFLYIYEINEKKKIWKKTKQKAYTACFIGNSMQFPPHLSGICRRTSTGIDRGKELILQIIENDKRFAAIRVYALTG